MKKLMTMARQFRDDDNGAAMVEYSILVGIIAAAAILAISGDRRLGHWAFHRPVRRAGSLADRRLRRYDGRRNLIARSYSDPGRSGPGPT